MLSIDETPEAKWHGPTQSTCRPEHLMTPGAEPGLNSAHIYMLQQEMKMRSDEIDLAAILERG
jgi:hypothetical protein